MSATTSFFVLALVIGFPRIYGTELPMALLLLPFYFVGFLRQVIARGRFSFTFIILFSVWIIGGAFCYMKGDGVLSDFFFHLVISVKMLLNFFFGYVVYRVIKKHPIALLWWLIFQMTVAVCSILSTEFYTILLGFISPRSADVFQHVVNLRALGFGLFHVDGALTIVIATFFYMLVSPAGNKLMFILMLPISMAMARSAVVPYAVLGGLKRSKTLKLILFFSIIALMVLSLIVTNGPLFEATEIFRNFIEYGEFRSVSVSGMKEMYLFPNRFDVYLFGDGMYYSTGETLGFYMGTDIGYLRLLYFAGAWSVLIFFLLNTYYLFTLAFNTKLSSGVRRFSFALILIFFIINFKGLQIMPIFGIALYFLVTDSMRNLVKKTPPQ